MHSLATGPSAPVVRLVARQPSFTTLADGDGQPACGTAGLVALFRDAACETFAAGQTVFWEGDAATDTFTVSEGLVRLYRALPDGRRAITGFACEGEVVGLAFTRRYPCSAEAVGEVKLRRLTRRQLHAAVVESASLRAQALAMIAGELFRAQDQIVLLGRKTADERVGSFILAMASRIAHSRREIHLPMSRLDMADYLGLTIETVSRVLTRLQRDGIISFRGRYHLIIERSRALCDLSGYASEDDPDSDAEPPFAWAG